MEHSSQNKPGTIKVVSLVLFVLYSLILIGSINALESSLSNVGLLALGFVLVFTNIGIFFMLLIRNHTFPKPTFYRYVAMVNHCYRVK